MEITHSSIWQIERLLEEQFSTYRVNVDFVMNPGEDYIKIMAKVNDEKASVILNPEEVTPAFAADVLADKIKEQRAAKWPPEPPAKPDIVYCHECIHGAPNGKYGCKAYHFKLYEVHEMGANDFCSKGERR